MSLDLVSALGLSFDSEISDRGLDLQPEVIAFIDQRGRRLLIPLRGRRLVRQPCSAPAVTAVRRSDDGASTIVSGTIH
jgi:hypothetical protein